jgi:hypothetical protein
MHKRFRWESLTEREHLGPRRRWEYNINLDLKEVGWGGWTGLIWLGIETGCWVS